MKKGYLLLVVFVLIANVTFSQKSSLDYLKQKLNRTINHSIDISSNFGKYDSVGGKLYGWPEILDVDSQGDKIIVNGEFTYQHDDFHDFRTLNFEATIKEILDDFTVIKVIYQNKKDNKWYKLFPINNLKDN